MDSIVADLLLLQTCSYYWLIQSIPHAVIERWGARKLWVNVLSKLNKAKWCHLKVFHNHILQIHYKEVENFSQFQNSTVICWKAFTFKTYSHMENKEILIIQKFLFREFCSCQSIHKMTKVFHLRQFAIIYGVKHSKQLIHAQPNHSVTYTWL